MNMQIHSDIVWPAEGKYILAVSGGADSIALLRLMYSAAQANGYEMIVGHFDHGMRQSSRADSDFVHDLAMALSVKFVPGRAHLYGASEAAARFARYTWLEEIRSNLGANAVVTAHHRDDLVETSLLNLARGSGRTGLTPMNEGPILRPLIKLSRADLRAYLIESKVDWKEDETNADITNPRNFIRHELLPLATPEWTRSYLKNITKLAILNKKIDQSISLLIESFRSTAEEYKFPVNFVQNLSLNEWQEVLVAVSRKLDPSVELDHRIVSEIALFTKTSAPGRQRPLRKGLFTGVQKGFVRVYYMGIPKEGRR